MKQRTLKKMERVEAAIQNGMTVQDAIKKYRISNATYYNYKGSAKTKKAIQKVDQTSTPSATTSVIMALQAENDRLKRVVADLYLKTV